ncbi:MAG: hypothetical protein ABEI86_00505 [Halobacteriaceae archaeon]
MPEKELELGSLGPEELNVDWQLINIEELSWKEAAPDVDWKSNELKKETEKSGNSKASPIERQEIQREKFRELLEARSSECLEMIHNPDPSETHEVSGMYSAIREAVLEYVEDGEVTVSKHRTPNIVKELPDPGPELPKLYSCTCGARNMTWDEAGDHLKQIQ